MDSFLKQPDEKTGSKAIFIVSVIIGVLVIGGLLGLVSMKKSTQEIQKNALEGAFYEGSPEFSMFTKKIIAETDSDRTTEARTGLGTIMMSIRGKISNLTDKTLTGLEIKVAVVDSNGNPVKEKTSVVIPKEVESLAPGKDLPVQLSIEGFDKDDDRANIRWKVTAIKIGD